MVQQTRGANNFFRSAYPRIVRHLISLIAGIGKMNVKKFTFYTVIGAALWNTILAYLGFILGQHWEEVNQYTDQISLVIVILLVGLVLYFVYRHIKKKKNIASMS